MNIGVKVLRRWGDGMRGLFRVLFVMAVVVVGSTGQAEVDVLRLLIWEGHAPREHVASFERLFVGERGRPVRLDISYVRGSDDFYAAIRGKRVDVVMMTHHHFNDERFNYIKHGLLLPLDLANIPNFKHLTPSLQEAPHVKHEGSVYAVPVSQGPYGLVYNTERVAEPPTSWNALWDPRFKGAYVIGENEYVYNASITALALGYPRESISSYKTLNNPVFKRKLRELAVNAHAFWRGVDKAEDLAGQSLATSWGDSLQALLKQGERWEMAEPSEGAPSWVDNYAITWALADRPELKVVAETYINSVLSPQFQLNHIVRQLSLSPVITNIGDDLTQAEASRVAPYMAGGADGGRILQCTYSRRDRNGLKLLWREAMRGLPVPAEGRGE
jgi:spermidine/putrescine-binding protein